MEFRCRYCRIVLPEKLKTPLEREIWMSYHVKARHWHKIHDLSKLGKSWGQAITNGKENGGNKWKR